MLFSLAFKAQRQGSSGEPSLVGPTLTESASSPPSRFHQHLTILSPATCSQNLPPALILSPQILARLSVAHLQQSFRTALAKAPLPQ